MQGHERVLGESKQKESENYQEKKGLPGERRIRQYPAIAKLQGSGHVVSQNNGGQQEYLGGAQKIDDVLAGACLGLGRLLVTHQRIGDQGQGFIEQKQGEEIGGEGYPDGSGKGQSETGKVTGLRVLVERTHVADRVERGQDPEQRCPRRKEEAEGIHPKS